MGSTGTGPDSEDAHSSAQTQGEDGDATIEMSEFIDLSGSEGEGEGEGEATGVAEASESGRPAKRTRLDGGGGEAGTLADAPVDDDAHHIALDEPAPSSKLDTAGVLAYPAASALGAGSGSGAAAVDDQDRIHAGGESGAAAEAHSDSGGGGHSGPGATATPTSPARPVSRFAGTALDPTTRHINGRTFGPTEGAGTGAAGGMGSAQPRQLFRPQQPLSQKHQGQQGQQGQHAKPQTAGAEVRTGPADPRANGSARPSASSGANGHANGHGVSNGHAAAHGNATAGPSTPAPGHGSGPAASSSPARPPVYAPSRPLNTPATAIDLTAEDDGGSAGPTPTHGSSASASHPFAPPPPPPNARQPICIGSIDSMALILYPSAFVQRGHDTDALLRAGEVRIQPNGDEWLKVKMKLRRAKAGKHDECINIVDCNNTGMIGVANEPFFVMMRDVLDKGLARLEGYVKRGDTASMFTAPINILIFTLPSNTEYIAHRCASFNTFLDHPLPYYIQSNHAESPPYLNPHDPPREGFRESKRQRMDTLMAGQRSGMAVGKTVEVQREQVDQLFKSLKGGDELDETDPGKFVRTKLFPHQKKALTFLRLREQEPQAIKDASLQAALRADEVVNLDGEEEDEEEAHRRRKKAARKIKKKGINSLWEAVTSSDKIKGWRNLVTEQIEMGKEKPIDMRGAILADDMGLGKTLSIVSLIASTIKSARKFAEKSPHLDSDDSDEDDEPEISASHFSGAVFDMPDPTSAIHGKGKKGKKAKAPKKMAMKHRASRLTTRSRATLLICPLSTVTNWEDQIKEHWAGDVLLFEGSKVSGDQFRRADPDTLKVYVYHGPGRETSIEVLANFDIVIATFNTLSVEYSRQLKTAETSEPGSAYASPVPDNDDGDDVAEIDEEGNPVLANGQKMEVERERIAMEKAEKAKGKRKRGAGDEYDYGVPKSKSEKVSPLQAIEWFRVVLDEAHFIKDASTIAARAACYLEAERRICLTGTPIQNKIDDVWALLKFLRFAPFDDKSVWIEYILGLAKAGNSLGVARLQTILKHCTLRRTKESTTEDGKRILNLPPRREEIREIEFDVEEQEIYNKYFTRSKQDFIAMQDGTQKTSYVNVLQQILQLRQICDHRLLPNDAGKDDQEDDELIAEAEDEMGLDELRALVDSDSKFSYRRAWAIATRLKADGYLHCGDCQSELDVPDLVKAEEEAEEEPGAKGKGKKRTKAGSLVVLTKCFHPYCRKCFAAFFPGWPKIQSGNPIRQCNSCRLQLSMQRDVIELSPGGAATPTGKVTARRKKKVLGGRGPPIMSSKMRSLLSDLMEFSRANPASSNYDFASQSMLDVPQELDEAGQPFVTKTVVFSQWTTMLDHIELMLQEVNIGYARLDGTMGREERAAAMEDLRKKATTEVLLVSLRAGGVGLNLTAATRCYLIDPYWNPSVENQAVDRIHRLGQKRPVVSTKFIIKGTIEEKMLQVQKRKAELAKLSLSQTISKKDLHERRLEDLKMLFS